MFEDNFDCGMKDKNILVVSITYCKSSEKVHEDDNNEENEDEEGDVGEVGHVVEGDVGELELANKHGERLENREADLVQELPFLVALLVDLLNDLFPDVGASVQLGNRASFLFWLFFHNIIVQRDVEKKAKGKYVRSKDQEDLDKHLHHLKEHGEVNVLPVQVGVPRQHVEDQDPRGEQRDGGRAPHGADQLVGHRPRDAQR